MFLLIRQVRGNTDFILSVSKFHFSFTTLMIDSLTRNKFLDIKTKKETICYRISDQLMRGTIVPQKIRLELSY